jgi:carbonic anhydrase
VVACMDVRLRVEELLGLQPGDAHVIRNAGGVVTDDAIRSLALSQRFGGTEEIVVLNHTDCAMFRLRDEPFGPPDWSDLPTDVDESVRRSLERIQASPFIPRKDKVRGVVYEVETRNLREVQ